MVPFMFHSMPSVLRKKQFCYCCRPRWMLKRRCTSRPQDRKTTRPPRRKNRIAWALPPPSACLPFVVWIIHKTNNSRFGLLQLTLSAFYCLKKIPVTCKIGRVHQGSLPSSGSNELEMEPSEHFNGRSGGSRVF